MLLNINVPGAEVQERELLHKEDQIRVHVLEEVKL